MCRLFGVISKKQTDASYWFFNAKIPFKDFSEKVINRGPHNSGWGVAWLENKKWNIFKEGKDDVEKYDFNRIREIESKIILIHLRHASSGDNSTRNAHPFMYKNWIFEHNGGVDRKKVLPYLTKKFKCQNSSSRILSMLKNQRFLTKEIKTDDYSEVYFLLIMQFFQESKDIIKAIKKTLEIIRKYHYRGLNFLMSDGENLYAFRDVSPKHKDLYDYYCLHYLEKDNKVIFSSDALSDDKWIEVKLGQLVVVDEKLRINKIEV